MNQHLKQKQPIKRQIIFGFSSVIALLIVFTVIFYNFLNKVNELENDLEVSIKLSQNIENIKHTLLSEQFMMMEVIESSSDEQLDHWEKTHQEQLNQLEKNTQFIYIELTSNKNFKKIKNQIISLSQSTFDDYKSIMIPQIDAIFQLSRLKVKEKDNSNKNKLILEIASKDTEFDNLVIPISKKIIKADEVINSNLKLANLELKHFNSVTKKVIFTVGIAFILLCIYFALIINKRINLILGEDPVVLAKFLKQLAEGDIDIKTNPIKEKTGLMISIQTLIDRIIDKSLYAAEIGQGNFESQLNVNSEKDILGNQLIKMSQHIQEKSTEITNLTKLQDAIFNSTQQAIISTDKEGTIILFNRAAEKMLGYTAEEIVNKTSPAIFHDLDEVIEYAGILTKELGYEVQPGFDVFILKAIKNGLDSRNWTYIRKDNTKLNVNLITSPVLNDKGEIIAYTGVASDITQSINDNNEIELLKKAIDQIAIFSIADQKGKIIEVNNKFLEISGYNREELIGQDHHIINSKHHPKEFFNNLWQTIASGEIWNGEIKNRKKDGEYYWVNTTIIPIKDNLTNSTRYISLRFDITKKKNIEAELIDEKERVEKLVRAKDEFMSSMSHEIRTPLNGIIGFTEILLKDKQINPTQLQQLQAIKTSGDILLVIINDILDIAKIESGKMNIEEVPVNIHELIPVVLDTFSTKINEKELNLKIHVDAEIPTTILSDSVRLSQIILNFVSNAIKFTPEKGNIIVSASINKKINSQSYLKLSISDTGIGIPENKLAHIFEAFVQTENDTARKYGGTGLGLTIVKKIVDLMEGEVLVESTVGEGTTFTVLLPLKTEELTQNNLQNDKIQLSEKKREKIIETKSLNILLVEDNAINILLAQTVLDSLGFNVVTAENGQIALDILLSKEHTFDLILMDLMMPILDGYEASILIRSSEDEQMKNIPIIALTADVTPSVKERCNSIGINAYISKPFDSSELNGLILNLTKEIKH